MKYLVGLVLLGLVGFGLFVYGTLRVPALVSDIEAGIELRDYAIRTAFRDQTEAYLETGQAGGLRALLEEVAANPLVSAAMIVGPRQTVELSTVSEWGGRYLESPCAFPGGGKPGRVEAIHIREGDREIGHACLRFAPASERDLLSRIGETGVIAGIGLVFFIVLYGWTAERRLTDRLAGFGEVIRRFHEDDVEARINPRGNDEVARFGRTLDKALQAIQQNTLALRTSDERFRLAAQGSNDVIFDWEVESDKLYLSPRVAEILGGDERDIPRMMSLWKKRIHAEDRRAFERSIEDHLENGRPLHVEFRIEARDGKWRWFLGRGQAFTGKRGYRRLVGSFTDITKIKDAESALQKEKERVEITLQSIGDGVITTDTQGMIEQMNRRAEELTGWPLGSSRGSPLKRVFDIRNADNKQSLSADSLLKRVLTSGEHINRSEEVVLVARSGTEHYIDQTAAPITTPDGFLIGAVLVFRDVSERRRLDAQLRVQQERASVTLSSLVDGVITTDANGRVDYLNPRAERLTGWSADEARGGALEEIFNVLDERTRFPLDVNRKVLQEGQTVDETENGVLVARNGEEYFVDQSIAPIMGENDKRIGLVVVFQDTTDRRKLLRQLRYQANHDALTKLINRYEFERRLKAALQTASDGQRRHVLAYLDLDQFKLVNDTSGHEAGDQLLRSLAAMLRSKVRKEDTLARLGGDEFALLMEQTAMAQAVERVKGLRTAISEYRFQWEGNTFTLGVSVGLIELNASSGPPQEILRAADQACYMAKSKGRNFIQVYEEGDEEASYWLTQMQWVNRLTQAIDEDRLVLHAQRIVPLKDADSGFGHYEILVRYQDADGRIISPGTFLPAAERYGLSGKVDRWVTRRSVEMIAEGIQNNIRTSANTFSINLSGLTLAEEGFLGYVKQLLDTYEVPPEMICFELTETAAVANYGQANEFIRELKKFGCRFSLDDFGSGFASFGYLKNLHVDYLKIDGSFVRQVATETLDRAMVSSINYIGHVMGVKTIAEFVENEDIAAKLRRMGVDYGQGFYFGASEPLESIFQVSDSKGQSTVG